MSPEGGTNDVACQVFHSRCIIRRYTVAAEDIEPGVQPLLCPDKGVESKGLKRILVKNLLSDRRLHCFSPVTDVNGGAVGDTSQTTEHTTQNTP